MDFKKFVFVTCIGLVVAQTEPSISDAINNLPPELQEKIDEKQVSEITNKTVAVFKQKCETNAGPEAYQKAESALLQFNDCMKLLVDVEKLKQEVKEAKPTGQVDEVFKGYCQKTPQFKACFKNLTETVKPCFTVEEQKNLNTVYNVSEQLAEFVCFKEGDRIALFISENGPECIQEKQAEIEQCLNSTLGGDLRLNSANISSLDSIPKISFGDKECNQLADLQICVVSALETCSAPTAANIVESLFKFARKATPCKEIPDVGETRAQKDDGSSAGRVLAGYLAMAAAVLVMLV